MGLAAIELYLSTKKSEYLVQAKQYSEKIGNGKWAAWCCVTSALNYRLSKYDETAKLALFNELNGYQNYDQQRGNIWGIPMVPSWATLHGQAIAGAYSGLSFLLDTKYDLDLLWNNLDYYFGRNNWGASFIALPQLKNAATNVYSQIYSLTGEYPLGAVSEGPGSKQTYQGIKRFFKSSVDDKKFEPFNTKTQIFYDNSSNFQTMESTIVGQATAIYLLTIAEKVACRQMKVTKTKKYCSS